MEKGCLSGIGWYKKNKLDKITEYSILEKAVKSPSPERVFWMVNHDWFFAGNQFKKTFNELLFTRRMWVENRSCCFAYFAYCVCERCLDYGRFEFTKEKSDLSFLSVWEVRDVGVLRPFVLDCWRVEPINIIRCQFWFLFLGFHLCTMVKIIEDESFVDVWNRQRHRRRLWYSRHRQWKQCQQKLHRQTRGHCWRGGTQRRQLNLQRTDARGHNLFFFRGFQRWLSTVAFLRGGLWIFAMVAIMLIDIFIKKYQQRVG